MLPRVEWWFGGPVSALVDRYVDCQAALQEYTAWIEGHIRRCLRELEQDSSAPKNLTHLLLEMAAARQLESTSIAPLLFFLMAAGHETTASAIANGIQALLEAPLRQRASFWELTMASADAVDDKVSLIAKELFLKLRIYSVFHVLFGRIAHFDGVVLAYFFALDAKVVLMPPDSWR